MNFYIIGIVVFSIVFIVCLILLFVYINDEKKIKEITDNDLMKYGKIYSVEEFQERLFNQYSYVLDNIQISNYTLLKDMVSDEIYNQILLDIKKDQDNNEKSVVTNIRKEFCKLIGFNVNEELEVAKLWVRYSCNEYVKGIRKVVDDDNNEVDSEIVIRGSQENKVNHEYILTFVKNRLQSENIVCPNCGYQTHLILFSNCARCESRIVPKKMHWVLLDKVTTNISKQK